jgi:hypothetical protein
MSTTFYAKIASLKKNNSLKQGVAVSHFIMLLCTGSQPTLSFDTTLY